MNFRTIAGILAGCVMWWVLFVAIGMIRHILDHLERHTAAAHSAHASRATPAAAVPKRTVSEYLGVALRRHR